mgnify:CR=1 FL=1
MKAYVKPAMMALSISANDMLCGSCSYSTRENKDTLGVYQGMQGVVWDDKNGDGVIDPKESNIFGQSDECGYKTDGLYCKYTSADISGYQQVFTS